VERLVAQLDGLVEAGNSVIVVEHEMRIVVGSDWVIDIGPGAGEEGGRVVAAGTPAEVAWAVESRTAPYLARFLGITPENRVDAEVPQSDRLAASLTA
jgi:excinuclease ABC subunit A